MAPSWLLVCGHANLDVQVQVKELPRGGISVPALHRRTVWGGTACNIARHAAGLGVPTRLWARVGHDFPADWEAALAADGLDLSLLERDPARATPSCFVFTDLLERQSYVMDQGAMGAMTDFPPDPALASGNTWVHLSTGDPVAYAPLAARAKEVGAKVALDPGQELRYQYDARRLRGMLAFADILFVNQVELGIACDLLEAADAEALLAHVPVVVVTKGAQGASLHRRGHAPLEQPARQAKVVDPTGAGDAFRAGWYAALYEGLPQDQALEWAQAAAAVVVGMEGPQPRALRRIDIGA